MSFNPSGLQRAVNAAEEKIAREESKRAKTAASAGDGSEAEEETQEDQPSSVAGAKMMRMPPLQPAFQMLVHDTQDALDNGDLELAKTHILRLKELGSIAKLAKKRGCDFSSITDDVVTYVRSAHKNSKKKPITEVVATQDSDSAASLPDTGQTIEQNEDVVMEQVD
jgi:hypothetical protein